MPKINNPWRSIVIVEHAALVVALLLGASFAAGYRYADTPQAAAADAANTADELVYDLACRNGLNNLNIRQEPARNAASVGTLPPRALFQAAWGDWIRGTDGSIWLPVRYETSSGVVDGFAMQYDNAVGTRSDVNAGVYILRARDTSCAYDPARQYDNAVG